MEVLRICLIIGLATGVASQIWIPKKQQGFLYKGCEAEEPLYMDAFLDLICGDSRKIYPNLIQLAKIYGPHCLQLRVHMNPLPYHTWGYYAGKGAFIYEKLKKKGNTFDWFSAVYAVMDYFTNKATMDKNSTHVLSDFADLAETLDVCRDKFFSLLSERNEYDTKARIAWKYSASRGIHSTPMVMINGVFVFEKYPQNLSLEKWKEIIDGILAAE